MTEKFDMLVIVAMMRTGSNLLERLLAQHPQISIFGEIFNKYFISRPNWHEVGLIDLKNRNTHYDDLLAFFSDRCAPNLPVFRLFDDHEPYAIERVLRDRKIAKIILERDPFDCYLSLLSAQKTEQWRLGRLEKSKSELLHFDLQDYQKFEKHARSFYTETKHLLDVTDQEYLSVNYADIKQIDTLTSITDFAGLSDKKDLYFINTDKQQSADKLNLIENLEDIPADIRHRSKSVIIENLGSGIALKSAYVSEKQNLAYVPILGTGEAYEISKLEKVEGAPLHKIPTDELADWLAQSPDRIAYSKVIHPAKRNYLLAFMHFFGDFDGFSGKFFSNYPNFFKNDICDLPLPKNQDELTKLNLKPYHFKKLTKGFSRMLRYELYGFSECLSSDQMWSQYLLLQNLNQKIPLQTVIEGKYPDHPAFDTLRIEPELKIKELWEPVRAGRFIYSGNEQLLQECFREDFDAYGFEVIGRD